MQEELSTTHQNSRARQIDYVIVSYLFLPEHENLGKSAFYFWGIYVIPIDNNENEVARREEAQAVY